MGEVVRVYNKNPLDGTGRRGNPIFKSPEDMLKRWVDYIDHCLNFTVTKKTTTKKAHKGVDIEGNNKSSAFEDIKEWTEVKPKTPTMIGFGLYCNIGKTCLYDNYLNKEEYTDVVSDIRSSSEEIHRQLFEQGEIPTQLSGLWMSNFGYSTKVDSNVVAEQIIKVEPSSHTIIKDMFKGNSKKT